MKNIPVTDTVYHHNQSEYLDYLNSAPWKRDRDYFKYCHISALAATKMVLHTHSGGNQEVMGYMIGKVVSDSFIIMDCMPLPVISTETRVNAHEDAHEYSVKYIEELSKSRPEKVVGWYHSHPGYGCWLSGIDVNTQQDHQLAQDPFLAIVIDPKKTAATGKIEIGAFRTYPIGTQTSQNLPADSQTPDSQPAGGSQETNELNTPRDMSRAEPGATQSSNSNIYTTPTNQKAEYSGFITSSQKKNQTTMLADIIINDNNPTDARNSLKTTDPHPNLLDQFSDSPFGQDINKNKKDDFGIHKDCYYSLTVTFYKNELDGKIIDCLTKNCSWSSSIFSQQQFLSSAKQNTENMSQFLKISNEILERQKKAKADKARRKVNQEKLMDKLKDGHGRNLKGGTGRSDNFFSSKSSHSHSQKHTQPNNHAYPNAQTTQTIDPDDIAALILKNHEKNALEIWDESRQIGQSCQKSSELAQHVVAAYFPIAIKDQLEKKKLNTAMVDDLDEEEANDNQSDIDTALKMLSGKFEQIF